MTWLLTDIFKDLSILVQVNTFFYMFWIYHYRRYRYTYLGDIDCFNIYSWPLVVVECWLRVREVPGMKKNEWPRRTDKSRTLKFKKKNHDHWPRHCYMLIVSLVLWPLSRMSNHFSTINHIKLLLKCASQDNPKYVRFVPIWCTLVKAYSNIVKHVTINDLCTEVSLSLINI